MADSFLVEHESGLLPVVVSDSFPVPGSLVLTAIKPDFDLLETDVNGVAEDDEPCSSQDEERVQFVGMSQATDEETENRE